MERLLVRRFIRCKPTALRVVWVLSALLAVMAIAICANAAEVKITPAHPSSGFRFCEVNDRPLGPWEGGKPAVSADRARSSYIHPLCDMDGGVLTDDLPKDHYHHRGLFWGWPHVTIDGKSHDLWMLKEIAHRFKRWLAKEASATNAVLGVEYGW